MYNGRGRIVDTSPYVQYTVRYSCLFAKPKVGAKVYAKIVDIIKNQDSIIVMS